MKSYHLIKLAFASHYHTIYIIIWAIQIDVAIVHVRVRELLEVTMVTHSSTKYANKKTGHTNHCNITVSCRNYVSATSTAWLCSMKIEGDPLSIMCF